VYDVLSYSLPVILTITVIPYIQDAIEKKDYVTYMIWLAIIIVVLFMVGGRK
jgi:EamA domain-containing membrane protein RarD